MDDAVVKVKIKEHDDLLREHDRRLDKIEQDAVEFKVHIKNLCKKINELTNWIKALVGTIVAISLGFIIWYIQSLPRG
jgi:phage host-nuclease inhibitor protein Gam